MLRLADRVGHRDLDALAGDRRRARATRQLHVDAALDHRRRHHEDDEQHEHDVDQRDDVDLGERRRHAAAAARLGRTRLLTAGPSFGIT